MQHPGGMSCIWWMAHMIAWSSCTRQVRLSGVHKYNSLLWFDYANFLSYLSPPGVRHAALLALLTSRVAVYHADGLLAIPPGRDRAAAARSLDAVVTLARAQASTGNSNKLTP
jgi:hypothetical protein